MRKTIVFDLDGTLDTPYFGEVNAESVKEWMDAHETGYTYGQLELPLEFCGTRKVHFFLNGAFELLRWVRDKGFEIVFFSNAVKERNDLLLPVLMERAFKGEKPPPYRYYSRTDCLNLQGKSTEERHRMWGLWEGCGKKPLAGKIVPHEAMPNTLMIDDDRFYAIRGEERNYVVGPYVCPELYLEYFCGRMKKYFTKHEFGFHCPFYYCGILKRALEYAEGEGIPLRDAAYRAQFTDYGKELPEVEEWIKGGRKSFWFENPVKNFDIYHAGLMELRKYNPGLKFWSISDEDARVRYKDDIADDFYCKF